ncbi:MAG: hypothetical protein GKR88_11205 [Flavobacteriaceae bacterium]|nr:MAG: hypothetical protein GKR88_11205 [Flavobacteriaceae bacterium]
MKFKFIITVLLTILSYNISVSQNKKDLGKIYSYENKKVMIGFAKKTKTSITKKCQKKIGPKNIASFIVAHLVLPYVFNNISKLFYNPNKYVKEHSDSYPLFKENAIEHIDNIRCLQYKKTNGNKESLVINLTLKDFKNNKNFKIVHFESLAYNYTNVKLKNNHHHVNVVVELFLEYYNSLGELKTFTLGTFNFNNMIPDAKNNSKDLEDIFTFVPTINPIKSIHIKVTEVNARKKDWDTWLELYNKHKDKIQSSVLETISLD